MDTRARAPTASRNAWRAGGAGLFEMGAPGSSAASLDAMMGSRARSVSRSNARL